MIPVKLVGFQGIRNGNVVNLSWNTSTESNNKGFNVERSADGINFKKLGLVNSKAIGGNSSVNLDYTFTDLQPLQSYNYYRLAQVDLDEKYTYSKTVLVRFDKQGAIFINNIYPTPASAVLHVSVESGIKTNGTLSVIDMSGKTVNLSNINLTRGNNIFDVDVSSLSKGIYFLKINWNNKEIATEKWVKD